MIIFWAITPLQTAIFGTQAVILTAHESMQRRLGLLTLEEQALAVDGSIFNDAYGVTWLRQEFPAYTTAEYAILPFEPAEYRSLLPNETWAGTTTKFTTSLACWPASVNKSESPNTFEFDNKRGCKAQISLFYDSPTNNPSRSTYVHGIEYIGYHESAFLDMWLQGPSCSQNSSHQFLAIYSGYNVTSKETEKMTAMFCQPSYYKQNVSIIVFADKKQPQDSSLAPLSEVEDLTEGEFNSTALEALMSIGIPPVVATREYPNDIVLQQFFQLFDQAITWPIAPMTGFALGRTNLSLSDLSDPRMLADVFTAAHRLVFSMAVPKLVSAKTITSTDAGKVQYLLYGVVVSRSIAIAVEVLLVAVAFLTIATLLSCRKSKSQLFGDPASLGKMFVLLKGSTALLNNFAPKDSYDDANLRQSITGQLYQLVPVTSYQKKKTCRLQMLQPHDVGVSHPQANRGFTPVRPKELSPLTGVGFIIVLLSAGVVLMILKRQELILNGKDKTSR